MQFGSRSKFQVQTGQWYDLRIEVSGHHARCFIDDKLVNEGTDPRQHFGPPFFASASYITATQEAIVKVVNFGGDVLDATLNLRGAGSVGATGKAILLSGDPQRGTLSSSQLTSRRRRPKRISGPRFSELFRRTR